MESIEELYRKMLNYKEAVMRLFIGLDKSNLDVVMRTLSPEDKRAEFEMGYKRFASTLGALMPSHVNKDDINDLKWLSYVRAGAKARYEPDTQIDISDCGEKARKIISEHLESEGVIQWIAPITLFEKDFERKINSLDTDEAIASGMEHAIKHVINVRMDDNPVYFTSLREKLQKILDETETSWHERKKQLQEFIDRDIDSGEEEIAKSLGFENIEELSIFEVIKKELTSVESKSVEETVSEDSIEYVSDTTIQLAKEITLDVVNVIKENYLIGWIRNSSKTDDMEKAIFRILIKKYVNKIEVQKLKRLSHPLLQLAKRHYDII